MALKSKSPDVQPEAAKDGAGVSRKSSKPKVAKGKRKAHNQQNPESPRKAVDDAPLGSLPETQTDKTAWTWTTLTEQGISQHPAVFTHDARYFFVIVGSSVKVHSAATGAVVSTLLPTSNAPSPSTSASQSTGHTHKITSLMIHPGNPLQLLTASLDGTIKVWDYLDAEILATVDVQQPVTFMCADSARADSVFIASTKPNPKERSVVYRVSLRQTTDDSTATCERLFQTKALNSLAMSPSGRWLVATSALKIYCAPVTPGSVGAVVTHAPSNTISSFAFHPTDEYFAIGCVDGSIWLWYCLTTETSKQAQTTMLHWHSHAVASLSFTPSGAYLLSGGEEAVLVIWQLDTNKKDFVPRLGAPIVSIAVTPVAEPNEGYLLCLEDGTLSTVDAARRAIRQEISGVKIAPPHMRPALTQRVPLAVHEASSSIVLPSSHPSTIQFYDPFSLSLKSELEIAPSNRVSRLDEEYLEPVRVHFAVTCPSGRWLATIDARANVNVHLKIWSWNGKTWSLNTRVDRPHGDACVTALAFNPKGNGAESWQLVTLGEDTSIKTWTVKSVPNERGRSEIFWVNRSTFSWRGQVPRSVAWSPDGSIFVVTFTITAVVFDPRTNDALQVLTCPEVNDIVSTTFVGSAGQYLAVASHGDIAVWDLVSGSVIWHNMSNANVQGLIGHPTSDSFIVLSTPSTKHGDGDMTFMNLVQPDRGLKYAQQRFVPFTLRECAFFPLFSNKKDDYLLFGITQRWEIMLLGDEVTRPVERARSVLDDGSRFAPRTLLQDIFGPSAILNPSSQHVVTASGTAPRNMETLDELKLPAFEQPPLGRLFDNVMARIVGKRVQDEPTTNNSTRMEVDEPVVEGSSGLMQATIVDEEPVKSELDALVQMFRGILAQPLLSVPPPPKSLHLNGNGVHKTATPKTNGNSAKARPPPIAAPIALPRVDVDVEMDVDDDSPVVGQKRKKKI